MSAHNDVQHRSIQLLLKQRDRLLHETALFYIRDDSRDPKSTRYAKFYQDIPREILHFCLQFFLQLANRRSLCRYIRNNRSSIFLKNGDWNGLSLPHTIRTADIGELDFIWRIGYARNVCSLCFSVGREATELRMRRLNLWYQAYHMLEFHHDARYTCNVFVM